MSSSYASKMNTHSSAVAARCGRCPESEAKCKAAFQNDTKAYQHCVESLATCKKSGCSAPSQLKQQ